VANNTQNRHFFLVWYGDHDDTMMMTTLTSKAITFTLYCNKTVALPLLLYLF